MRRLAALATLALALAGCGGTTKPPAAAPKPPRLPRTLAQPWAQQADGIASALAAGDGCTAQQLAGMLRTEVVQALNERLIPHAFQEQLLSTVNDLPDRIVCTPAPPPDQKHDHKKKHGDHGGDGG